MKRPVKVTVAVLILATALAAAYFVRDVPGPQADWSETIDQGIGQFQGEQYEAALETLQAIPPAEATDWRVPYYIGSSHMMLKDYPAAAVALEQSLALKPDEAGTLYALGVAYFKQGKLKLAKGYFAAVLEIRPGDEHAKGLMDIMERLEQQTAAAQADQGDNGGS